MGPCARRTSYFDRNRGEGSILREVKQKNWRRGGFIEDGGRSVSVGGRLVFLYQVDVRQTADIVGYWCPFDEPERFDGSHLALL